MQRLVALGLGMLLVGSLLAIAEERVSVDLRVLTYNIHHGVGADGVLDLHRVGDLLKASGADVIALNEVDKGVPRSRYLDQARVLADRLDMHFAFGPNLHYFGGEYGNAILSRFPIVFRRNVPLRARGRERRGLLHVILDVSGSPLHVLTTHLEVTDPTIRDLQVREISEYIRYLDGPIVLMGDFNSDAGIRDPSGLLFPRLHDAWVLQQLYFGAISSASAGGPHIENLTFDSVSPTRRIDYVFISGEVVPTGPGAIRTIPSQASDHLPVAADLRVELVLAQHRHSPNSGQNRAIAVRAAAFGPEQTGVVESGPVETAVAFVTGSNSPDRDAQAFQTLFKPGRRVRSFSMDALGRLDVRAAPESFPIVVLHNVKVLDRRVRQWLSDYQALGGRLVALGSVGLRFVDSSEIPPLGSVVANLFSVRVVGWTHSDLLPGALLDCRAGRSIKLRTRGMLHFEALGDAWAALRFGTACDDPQSLAVAVATDQTLYVGFDPLLGEPPQEDVVEALRRSLEPLFDTGRAK